MARVVVSKHRLYKPYGPQQHLTRPLIIKSPLLESVALRMPLITAQRVYNNSNNNNDGDNDDIYRRRKDLGRLPTG